MDPPTQAIPARPPENAEHVLYLSPHINMFHGFCLTTMHVRRHDLDFAGDANWAASCLAVVRALPGAMPNGHVAIMP